ncbi:hypothetical protein Zmor_008314 [Zophobas morio]|uniref:Fibrinogen C-terminal domain-containing protein n=1 Tax=Zophobas morio TaxID=2755281 RepID=A0AA38J131_9CUCU|nr:hypothetical protein Zmor_008314 [Zophobas morio]
MLSLVLFVVCFLSLAHAQTPGRYPKSCYEAKSWNRTNSNHVIIRPELAPEPFVVLCDMDIDEGGWTYILNRYDGSQNFSKNWDSYKAGFGHIAGEFWLGLEKIYQLVALEINELRVELTFEGEDQRRDLYTSFGIGDEKSGYVLHLLDPVIFDATDCMSLAGGMKFSTIDKDQDLNSTHNCAEIFEAGWWFRNCTPCGLPTGVYLQESIGNDDAHRRNIRLKEASIMIRSAAQELKLPKYYKQPMPERKEP